MANLQQIDGQSRALISQLDPTATDITKSILDGMINEAIRFLATKLEYPRDLIYVQVTQGVAVYPLPSDWMRIRTAYFGNTAVSADVVKIALITEQRLGEINPSWLDQTTSSQGPPNLAIILDKKNLLLHPTPDAQSSAVGKQLILDYVYYPAPLVNDSDVPDLPLAFHDLIKFYVGYLAYEGILKNPKLGMDQLNNLLKMITVIQVQTNDELDDKSFAWGNYEDMPSNETRLATLKF